MEVVQGYPPNYEKIKAAFDIGDRKVVFTYGQTIYNPHRDIVSDHLRVHETVHMRQQLEMGIEEWWDKYIEDAEFRWEQEVEAYAHQYNFMKKACSNRVLKDFLFSIASDLSSPIYGNISSYQEAETAIRRKAKDIVNSSIDMPARVYN